MRRSRVGRGHGKKAKRRRADKPRYNKGYFGWKGQGDVPKGPFVYGTVSKIVGEKALFVVRTESMACELPVTAWNVNNYSHRRGRDRYCCKKMENKGKPKACGYGSTAGWIFTVTRAAALLEPELFSYLQTRQ